MNRIDASSTTPRSTPWKSPSNCADDPLRVDRYVGDERDFDYVSVHALKLSPASPEPPAREYLDALRAIAEENGAASVSDHLGFTRDGDRGVEMGHFAPPPLTPAALDATCRNVEMIQRYFGPLHFYLENIAYLFKFQGTLTEAEFLVKLLERTGCGWLLDVTNVYANSINHGYDARAFIAEVLTVAPRVQMHLAGGYFDDRTGLYYDTHSEPIPDEVWDLYRYALSLAHGKVDAVFIERDQNFPSEADWRREVRTHAPYRRASGGVRMKLQATARDKYCDQLSRIARALAAARVEEVQDALAPESQAAHLRIFVDDNVGKRQEKLKKQVEFLGSAFADLDGLVAAYAALAPGRLRHGLQRWRAFPALAAGAGPAGPRAARLRGLPASAVPGRGRGASAAPAAHPLPGTVEPGGRVGQ